VDAVHGRWSSHGAPLRQVPSSAPIAASSAATGGTAIFVSDPAYTQVFDQDLIQREYDVTAKTGGEEVAVAILRASEAFAFTDESYNYPAWGRPDLKLDRGTYRVVVHVHGSSIDYEQSFKLEYLSDDFARFQLARA